MKRQQKLTVKKVLKTILSASLALVLAIGVAFLPDLNVSAEEILILNEESRVVWGDAGEATVSLSVDETGFYKISFTDNEGADNLSINVSDITEEPCEIYYSVFFAGDETFVADELYLRKNREYELSISYYSQDALGGDVNIRLEKSDFAPTDIYDGSISVSDSFVEFDGDKTCGHFKFTPASSGDYVINYTGNIHGYIFAYDTTDGSEAKQETAHSIPDSNTYTQRKKAIFNLTADRTYIFKVFNHIVPVTSRFAMSKCERTISDVEIYEPISQFDSWSRITADSFIYTVTYTDSHTEKMTYAEMYMAGFDPAVFEHGNPTYEVNGEVLNAGGENQITLTYKGQPHYYEFDIPSVNDMLIAKGAAAGGVGKEYHITNQFTNIVCYHRINVSETGLYGFSSLSFYGYNIDFSIIDSKNVPAEYDARSGGWHLVSGEDYILSFVVSFYDKNVFDCRFRLVTVKEKLFDDTDSYAWYGEALSYVAKNGIMKGYENGNFGPSDGIQRQDFLVLLARYGGVNPEDYADYNVEFTDVQANSYYDWAVAWGAESGIVNGYDDGRFGVGDYITREQIVTFLCRYAQYKGLNADFESEVYNELAAKYSDYAYISEFALDSVVWAVNKGVINGKTENTIVPYGNAQRCEVAQIMYNIFKNEIF